MLAYVCRRILRALTTLLGTTLIIFVLVRVVPADPAVSIAGPKADPQTLAQIRRDLGLDAGYLSRILRDFGRRGLVDKRPSASDGRRSICRTVAGSARR